MEQRPVDLNIVANRWKNYKKGQDSKKPKPKAAWISIAPTMDIKRAIQSPTLKRSQSKRNLDRSMKRRDSIQERIMGGMKKGNWKKVFAFTKFISLAKTQSEQEPANLIIAKR